MGHCEWSSQLSLGLRGAPHKPGKLLSWGSLPQTLLGKLRTNQGNCFLGGVYLKRYWGSSAQTRETAFLGEFISNSTGEAPHKPGKLLSWGSLPQVLPGKLRANSGTSRTRLHTATGAAFPAGACTPINRQSPQRASSRLERGALWRSLAQPCARKPRNVSV